MNVRLSPRRSGFQFLSWLSLVVWLQANLTLQDNFPIIEGVLLEDVQEFLQLLNIMFYFSNLAIHCLGGVFTVAHLWYITKATECKINANPQDRFKATWKLWCIDYHLINVNEIIKSPESLDEPESLASAFRESGSRYGINMHDHSISFTGKIRNGFKSHGTPLMQLKGY